MSAQVHATPVIRERDILFTEDVVIAGISHMVELMATAEHGWIVKAKDLSKVFDRPIAVARTYSSPSERLTHWNTDVILTAAGVSRMLSEQSTPKRVAWMREVLPRMQRKVVLDWSDYDLPSMRCWISDYEKFYDLARHPRTTREQLAKAVKGMLWIPTRAEMDEQIKQNPQWLHPDLEEEEDDTEEDKAEDEEDESDNTDSSSDDSDSSDNNSEAEHEQTKKKKKNTHSPNKLSVTMQPQPPQHTTTTKRKRSPSPKPAATASKSEAAIKPMQLKTTSVSPAKASVAKVESNDEPAAKKRQLPTSFVTAEQARASTHEDPVNILVTLAMDERVRVLPKQEYAVCVADYDDLTIQEFADIMRGAFYKVKVDKAVKLVRIGY
jgi:hypothetical protein